MVFLKPKNNPVKKSMKHYLLWTMMVVSSITHAQTYECDYDFGNKQITIEAMGKQQIHTQVNENTLVHVQDTNNLNIVEDYIVLTQAQYKMTYALDCKRATK